MKSKTSEFNGTSFWLLVGGTKLGPFNIARNPQDHYWNQLLKTFEVAGSYDSTIQLSIGFCIQYHLSMYSDSSWANNKIFPMKVMQIITIPSNVMRFFQFLPVKELYDRFEKLKSEIESSNSKLGSLTNLEEMVGASVKEISNEIAQLQLEMEIVQLEFVRATSDLEAFRKLERAREEVNKRLQKQVVRLEVSTDISFSELMENTEKTKISSFEKLEYFSKKKRDASTKNLELSLIRQEIQSLLDYLGKAKQNLVKVKKDFLSSFEHLYPPTIKVYTRGDCAAYLETIESAKRAIESSSHDWSFFHHSDFVWYNQMPVLFGLMMTEMVKTSLSKYRRLKSTHLVSFHALFGKLPKDMQKLYVQHRFLIIEHSFLLILSSKLTNNCLGRQYSLTIQMRFLAKLAKKLILGLEFKNLHRLSIRI
jgi:uncharacterized small protein (DUF1192 family)